VVIGIVFESRLIPLAPKYQFVAVVPGIVLLGIAASELLVLAQNLPNDERWYNTGWWNLIVQIAALAAAVFVTYSEYKQKTYPPRAIFSPTKLYVNLALYGLFGYTVFVTFVAVLFGSDWSFGFVLKLIFLVLLPALIWVRMVLKENMLGTTQPERLRCKAAHAHVADWQPIWVTIRERREDRPTP
jgi:hypothetical protein